MSSLGRNFAGSASALLLLAGCERAPEQPWRKTLDEGRVVRLGGDVGRLSPPPTTANGSAAAPKIIVQPVKAGSTGPTKNSPVDELPIPPPPKAAEKKANSPSSDDEPKLGPPR